MRIGRGGEVASKPGQLVSDDAELAVEGGPRYVSRGGLKLESALDALGVEVEGRVCLDVGASTGGFTDCLLSRGAERVIALDVGHGQLDWALRNDDRVEVMERVNARGVRPDDLAYRPELVTIDVSFISLRKVLPAVVDCLAEGGEVLAMVKPQFELERRAVGKGGVVSDPAERQRAVDEVVAAARELGLSVEGTAPAGVAGPKGNQETFLWLR